MAVFLIFYKVDPPAVSIRILAKYQQRTGTNKISIEYNHAFDTFIYDS